MVDFTRMLKESVLLKETRWPTSDGATLNRNDFVTASEAAGCARKLTFNKTVKSVASKDATDDEYELLLQSMNGTSSFGYFERGHSIEAWAVKMLRSSLIDGEMLLIAGEEQVSFYDAKHKVSGTPDGVFYDPDNSDELTLLEIKSVGNIPSHPKDEHILQVQINMALINNVQYRTDKSISQVIGCPPSQHQHISSAKIIYIQSNNYMDMAEYIVEYDNGAGFNAAYEKACMVFIGDEVHKPKNVAPEGEATGECWFCDHKRHCRMISALDGTAQEDGVPAMPRFQEPSPVDQRLLDRYGDLYAQSKAAGAELDKHKKLVLKLFEATPEYQGSAKIDAPDGGYVMSIRSTERTAMDKKKIVAYLDATGGEMEAMMTTTTTKPGVYMKKQRE